MAHAHQAEAEEQLRDAGWLSRLDRNFAGRAVQDHLACLEHMFTSEGRDGSLQACVDNRKSLLHAVWTNARRGQRHPCNLPKPMPKYVAIVNLSGQNLLLHSNNDTLMRKLCHRSTAMHAQEVRVQLQQFTSWINLQHAAGASTQESFVLISYQLPWQGGIASMHWEISTAVLTHATESKDAMLVDRMKALSSMSDGVFRGKPSLLDTGCIPLPGVEGRGVELLNPKQVTAFREHYVATTLDHVEIDAEQDTAAPAVGMPAVQGRPVPSSSAPRGQNALDHNRSLMTAVMEQRRVVVEELAETKLKLKACEEAALVAAAAHDVLMDSRLKKAEAEAQKQLDLASAARDEKAAECDGMRKRMASMLTERSQSKSAHDKLKAQHDKLKSQTDAQNKLANATNQKLQAEKKDLESKLAAQERSHKQAMSDQTKAHHQELERSVSGERKTVTSLRAKLSSNEQLMNQLADNNDRKDADLQLAAADKTAVEASLRRRTAEVACLRLALRDADVALENLDDGIEVEPEDVEEPQEFSEPEPEPEEPVAPVAPTIDHCADDPWGRALAAVKLARTTASSTDTDTVGTQTHQCAMTQTDEQKRVLPQDLPSAVRVRVRGGEEPTLVPGTYDPDAPVPEASKQPDSPAPTTNEEPSLTSPTASTGSTSVPVQANGNSTNNNNMYQDPESSSVEMMPSFHAMTALSAVQWLLQWTQGCEQFMQQNQAQQQQQQQQQQPSMHGFSPPTDWDGFVSPQQQQHPQHAPGPHLIPMFANGHNNPNNNNHYNNDNYQNAAMPPHGGMGAGVRPSFVNGKGGGGRGGVGGGRGSGGGGPPWKSPPPHARQHPR